MFVDSLSADSLQANATLLLETEEVRQSITQLNLKVRYSPLIRLKMPGIKYNVNS